MEELNTLILRGHFDQLREEISSMSANKDLISKTIAFLERISDTLSGDDKLECQSILEEYHLRHAGSKNSITKRPMTRAGSRKRSNQSKSGSK